MVAILLPVLAGASACRRQPAGEVLVEAVADVVAVEQIGLAAHCLELALDQVSDRRVAGAESPVSQTATGLCPLAWARMCLSDGLERDQVVVGAVPGVNATIEAALTAFSTTRPESLRPSTPRGASIQ